MTLSTDIVIAEPVNPRMVFDFCLSLLNRDFDGVPTWEEVPASDGSEARYETTVGQGLPAWLFVYHATDGPMRLDTEYGSPIDEHCVRIDFDTGYSYDREGASCDDLHAWLVQEVGAWLDGRGIRAW